MTRSYRWPLVGVWCLLLVLAGCTPGGPGLAGEAKVGPARAGLGHPFRDGQRIAFLGDSITQSGEYIAFLQTYFWARHPDLRLEVINLGLSSETVNGASEPDHPSPRPCVHDRLDAALAAAKADWAFVCYGMNDGIYHPPSEAIQASYRDGLDRAIARIRSAGARVVPLTPPPFDKDSSRGKLQPLGAAGPNPYGYRSPYEDYDQVLGVFAAHVLGQADREGVAGAVDLHGPMNDYIRRTRDRHGKYVYGDAVHPPRDGHLKMALILLAALGEDAAAAEELLGRLTGVTLSPAPQGKPAVTPLYQAVLKRHQELSAAYREHIRQAPPGKAKAPPLPQALELAAQREQEIRQQVRAALAAPATRATE